MITANLVPTTLTALDRVAFATLLVEQVLWQDMLDGGDYVEAVLLVQNEMNRLLTIHSTGNYPEAPLVFRMAAERLLIQHLKELEAEGKSYHPDDDPGEIGCFTVEEAERTRAIHQVCRTTLGVDKFWGVVGEVCQLESHKQVEPAETEQALRDLMEYVGGWDAGPGHPCGNAAALIKRLDDMKKEK